jgi:hypothetical protein
MAPDVETRMARTRFLAAAAVLAAFVGLVGTPAPVPARGKADDPKPPAELKAKADEAVKKGLEYLKRSMIKDSDTVGHWEGNNGAYPSTMTALSGLAFLMEGSTLREGKYSDQIARAMNWFIHPSRVRENGQLGDMLTANERQRYMYGHGFGLLFLASVYGEEEDEGQRKKLEAVLKRAVDFTCKAQTSKKHKKRNASGETVEVEIGGWGYLSAAESPNGFDEGSVTITQLQALRAARNAGIPVPKESIQKAVEYLEACTTSKGGVVYQYYGHQMAQDGQERPAITAAAVACGFSAGEYDTKLTRMWLRYCRDNIKFARGRVGHEEYQSYYFSQVMYALGEERFGKMFPDEPDERRLKWSTYRDTMMEHLVVGAGKQNEDGSWSTSYIGSVYSTAVNLSILQLEKGILPIYQR